MPTNPIGCIAYDRTAGHRRGVVVAVDLDAGFYVVRDARGREVVARIERTVLRPAAG